jgi:hypothetical protein
MLDPRFVSSPYICMKHIMIPNEYDFLPVLTSYICRIRQSIPNWNTLFKTSDQRSESLSMVPMLPWPCHYHCCGWAAAKLLPPSCCHQAATAIAKLPTTAELPLPPLRCHCPRRTAAALPEALPPRPKSRFCQAAASATKLAAAATTLLLPSSPPPPPPPPLRCHRPGACRADAATAKLPLPPPHRHRAAAVATLPPPPPPCCRQLRCCAACLRCAFAAAGPLPPLRPHCHQ